ncbi:MAG: MBL fold metallo-hydrolase [Cytophagales bacterium]|nr:MBL fold metallo-hydrolase [Armatimonadota bacterium]
MKPTEIAPDVYWLGFAVANVYLVGEKAGPWVVVDTSTPGHFEAIKSAAEEVYGLGAKPDAIILTHAHFDHYGSALPLATYWNVPVYAQRLDLPYLTGKARLAPGDPTTDGFFAFAARFLPDSGTDLGEFVHVLPDDDSLPGMPGWRRISTPGHTPGHASLFREGDRTLIAGDAVLTVNLDKLPDLVRKEQEVSRPPTPLTYDWPSARRSVQTLAELRPQGIASGHGTPMTGDAVADKLAEFAQDFAAPKYGRYVAEPARFDENGAVFVPPPPPDYLKGALAGLGLAALIGLGIYALSRRGDDDEGGMRRPIAVGPMRIEDLEG